MNIADDLVKAYNDGYQQGKKDAVVRGEWVKKHNDVCFWYECSVCGHTPPRDKWGHTWFSVCCPNCGAKMEDKP